MLEVDRKIKIAIVGVGNCASSLVQGIEYYRKFAQEKVSGLAHPDLGGYNVTDIQVVSAFDVDRRKVGRSLNEALFAKPNCTTIFFKELPDYGVTVKMGPVLDGIAEHMKNYPDDRAFRVSSESPVDVVQELKTSGAKILVCYLPVGSEQAVRFYAKACLDAGVAMVNCVPVFIASHPEYAEEFRKRGLPIVGDDIKSQFGATLLHRIVSRTMVDRGVHIKRTYQLNTGGNTDFLNMLEHTRLKSKRISKTESVQSQLDTRLEDENIHIGPSDYVRWQNDNKICFLRLEYEGWGGVPMNLEARLSVEDSPNSAGVVVDAIRCAQLALDRKLGGPLEEISAFTMKHPPRQMNDSEASLAVKAFMKGETTR
ncbi:MAG: inositol-3-phosphate synthase [Caldithrix sp.]|nr:MAG: inositol-3-phosphate synthase [Caldithrix sp.]